MFDRANVRRSLLALALVAGCAPAPKEGEPVDPRTTSGGATTTGGGADVPGPPVEVDCEDAPSIDYPEWAANPDSPRPSRANLTGSWLPVYDPATYPPGIVKWQRSCYGGHNMLILMQDGDSLSSAWSSSDGVSGAQPEYSYYRGEQAVGTRRGDEVTLEGVRTDRKVSAFGAEDEVTCTALRYDLTYVAKTKRLVGTMNGHPVEFAPASIKATDQRDCGPPPP